MHPAVNPAPLPLADHDGPRKSWEPWESLPAAQQPAWRDHPEFGQVRRRLATAPPLVTAEEVADALRALAGVASGSARVLQIGDCAESFDDSAPDRTSAKLAVLDRLAGHMERRVSGEVVRFGRMAGQYAKPRSADIETVDGVDLPVFRGDMVNSADPTLAARRHDVRRMQSAYRAGAEVLRALRGRWREGGRGGPWASHEALVLDYEGALIRNDPATGRSWLGSTHFPWIGERTRQLDYAHVRMLASVGNPVGCKIGPSVDPETVVRLCEVLNPLRIPGRLTLIVRMGKAAVSDVLPSTAAAVRRVGHPVVWLSDPMHGNTVRTGCGLKTRYLADMIKEARCFRRVIEDAGLHAGGLHLEVADADVTECVGGPVPDESALPVRYESLCDPRLNPEQALELIDAVY